MLRNAEQLLINETPTLSVECIQHLRIQSNLIVPTFI